jgi:hypothetical protein
MPVHTEEFLGRLRSILQGRIFYPPPTKFNDPFEMSALIEVPSRDSFMELMSNTNPAATLLPKSAQERVYQRVQTTLGGNAVSREWIASIGVLCLSASYEDLLMWSHYSANHTGVCIGFDSDLEPFSTARPVRYQEGRAKVAPLNVSSTEEELVEKVLFVKSVHWKYEAEWRSIKRPIRDDEKDYYKDLYRRHPEKADAIALLLASEGGPGNYEFNTNAIRKIYLGACMLPEWKQRVIEAVHEFLPSVKIHEMSLDPRYFRLNQQKLKTDQRRQSIWKEGGVLASTD